MAVHSELFEAAITAPTTVASFEALGSGATVAVTERAALGDALSMIQAEVEAIDAAASRFRADSELEELNRNAGRSVIVSPLLIEAVSVAVLAAELSDGDVDPALGLELIAAGYDRDWQELDPPAATAAEPPRPRVLRLNRRAAWRLIEIDRAAGTIRIPAGVRLDLGATAKALTADRAAAAVAAALACGVLVSLGGDIATAGPPPPGGWNVHVTDDHRAGVTAYGQTVSIVNGGLATSSCAVRRWNHAGRNMHHIIDPRTGTPALSAWRTVSVAAASCVEANTASTAALVRGRRAVSWLETLGLPARLVDHAGRVQTVAGWPA